MRGAVMNSIELLNQYKNLKINGSYIGLEEGDETSDYFCTPVGTKIIGWDNGIHYCFIEGFGEVVFCVNPETCCDYYVYPLANNFRDFLSLILATNSTNPIQQIILWDKQEFEDFMNSVDEIEWGKNENVLLALNTIKTNLNIEQMNKPFEYVKTLQNSFNYNDIKFTNEYYDTLGLERPDGSELEEILEF